MNWCLKRLKYVWRRHRRELILSNMVLGCVTKDWCRARLRRMTANSLISLIKRYLEKISHMWLSWSVRPLGTFAAKCFEKVFWARLLPIYRLLVFFLLKMLQSISLHRLSPKNIRRFQSIVVTYTILIQVVRGRLLLDKRWNSIVAPVKLWMLIS